MTINKKDFMDKVKAIIVGHAVADALGVPVEFMSREELKANPVKDMQGHGTYPLPKGCWSDDTSMSLCALDAMHDGKINFDQVMLNFAKWYCQDVYTPTGEMFDVGNTCSIAIERYLKEGLSWRECGLSSEMDNGNGSLMRIHPFALYAFTLNTNTKTKMEIIELASALTHAHPRSKMACGIYACILWELLTWGEFIDIKNCVRTGIFRAHQYYESTPFKSELSHFSKLYYQIVNSKNGIPSVTEKDIVSDGYVVNTLEAAIWCLLTTNSYRECVLKAVNLGDDTDTVAAVAGGLAGAVYSYDNIPQEWKDSLLKRDYIEAMCEKVFAENN